MAELRKGWWDTGSALGTAALGLQVLGSNNCGGGLLGGILGGGNNCCQNELSTLKAELAKEKSERYADMVGVGVYKETVAVSNAADAKINANYRELAQEIAAMKVREAETSTALGCFQKGVEREFQVVRQEFTGALNCCCEKTNQAIQFEAERRHCADQNIYNYVNGTFVPGTLNIYAGRVCPTPVPQDKPTVTPYTQSQPLHDLNGYDGCGCK